MTGLRPVAANVPSNVQRGGAEDVECRRTWSAGGRGVMEGWSDGVMERWSIGRKRRLEALLPVFVQVG
jgi:hypothetical protein